MSRRRIMLLALAGVLALSAVSASAAPLSPSPAGKVYELTVFPEGGGPFMDCARFEEDGTIIIDTLGSGTWVLLAEGADRAAFMAHVVADFDPGYTVDIRGKTFGLDGEDARAKAIDSLGIRYRVIGVLNPACIVVSGRESRGVGSWAN